MKRILFVIGLALCLPALAQNKPAAEAAKPVAQAPDKPAVQAAAKPRKPNPKRAEDARHCLEKPSNTEVIKCAEEYL